MVVGSSELWENTLKCNVENVTNPQKYTAILINELPVVSSRNRNYRSLEEFTLNTCTSKFSENLQMLAWSVSQCLTIYSNISTSSFPRCSHQLSSLIASPVSDSKTHSFKIIPAALQGYCFCPILKQWEETARKAVNSETKHGSNFE